MNYEIRIFVKGKRQPYKIRIVGIDYDTLKREIRNCEKGVWYNMVYEGAYLSPQCIRYITWKTVGRVSMLFYCGTLLQHKELTGERGVQNESSI